MVSIQTFRQLALSFPGTSEQAHFEKKAFRTKKRIFATLAEKEKQVFIKLSEIDQSVYCSIDKAVIYPVPNKWGKQGWTTIELSKVKKEILEEALAAAFRDAAPKGK